MTLDMKSLIEACDFGLSLISFGSSTPFSLGLITLDIKSLIEACDFGLSLISFGSSTPFSLVLMIFEIKPLTEACDVGLSSNSTRSSARFSLGLTIFVMKPLIEICDFGCSSTSIGSSKGFLLVLVIFDLKPSAEVCEFGLALASIGSSNSLVLVELDTKLLTINFLTFGFSEDIPLVTGCFISTSCDSFFLGLKKLLKSLLVPCCCPSVFCSPPTASTTSPASSGVSRYCFMLDTLHGGESLSNGSFPSSGIGEMQVEVVAPPPACSSNSTNSDFWSLLARANGVDPFLSPISTPAPLLTRSLAMSRCPHSTAQ